MRRLTRDELKSIQIEEDMLKGNNNRMCVTDDIDELNSMAKYAMERVQKIFNVNLGRFDKVII